MKSEIVFVDPQDLSEPFWWPGIVVPPHDYEHFFKQMGDRIDLKDSVLVCYFEDASYSAVSITEIKLFDSEDPFFMSYFDDQAFLKTKGAKVFMKYLKENKAPFKFKWLRNKRKYVRKGEGCYKKKFWVAKAREHMQKEEGCH